MRVLVMSLFSRDLLKAEILIIKVFRVFKLS